MFHIKARDGSAWPVWLHTCMALCVVQSMALSFPVTDSAAVDTAAQHGFWSKYSLSKYAAGTLVGGSLVYAAGIWWINDFRPYHHDPSGWWDTDMGVDKEGHVFTCYYMFHAVNDILLYGGHDSTESFWWALASSALYGPAIELGDGFSQYGFDVNDMISDLTGVAYAALQYRVPFFRNFELKWSLYYPLNRHSFKINDLYDYHIYWISARVHDLLPAGAQPYWPDWLQMAFGFGTWNHLERTYVLSFDYDFEKIPLEGDTVSLLKKLLNMFHAPAPGVKFRKGAPPEWQLLLLH
jgi:hypothetical protein